MSLASTSYQILDIPRLDSKPRTLDRDLFPHENDANMKITTS